MFVQLPCQSNRSVDYFINIIATQSTLPLMYSMDGSTNVFDVSSVLVYKIQYVSTSSLSLYVKLYGGWLTK